MFRNKEIRQFAIVFLGLTVVFAAAGFVIRPAAGVLILASSAAFGVSFYAFTKRRYERIAGISEEIDEVLHDADHVFISDAEEGELSILQSEITKMTGRIREQNDALRKEKKHLADSLADVAHQLRTPLTSATLILSLLEENPEKLERKKLLREMEGLIVRMDWLITSLLKLSRLDAGVVEFKNEQVEVRHVINNAIQPLLIPMELHDITLEVETPKNVIIMGDEGWLSEGFQNIFKNCMESAGDGGKIHIFCEDTLLYTEIRIHDSGKGFRKEDLPYLFDRFYRGKNSGEAGYGIGLSLCKTILAHQGGTITAKNHPQGGAVFVIRFQK